MVICTEPVSLPAFARRLRAALLSATEIFAVRPPATEKLFEPRTLFVRARRAVGAGDSGRPVPPLEPRDPALAPCP